MKLGRWTAALAATTLSALPAGAQDVSLHGQVRPRFEHRDPTFVGPADASTSMRVRAGIEALLDDRVSVLIQMQDVRLWGEETGTLSDFRADNLDLHQGWVRIEGRRWSWLSATIGRQETVLGGERLVGAVDWAQQGQSFDGVRVDAARQWGSLSLLAYKVGEEGATTVPRDAELFGGYARLSELGAGSLDLYWLFDRMEGPAPTQQSSVGARWVFAAEGLVGRVEGTLQRGERLGSDVSAFMLGARVGRPFADERATLTLWYDHLSGDDTPGDGEVGSFQTLYATNHKFYGFADLFTAIPTHTAGLGLRDAAVKLAWRPDTETSLGADLHWFATAEQGTLSGTHLANELDLTVSRRYGPYLGASAGLSLVLQDAPLGEIGRLGEDMTWFWVMLDARF